MILNYSNNRRRMRSSQVERWLGLGTVELMVHLPNECGGVGTVCVDSMNESFHSRRKHKEAPEQNGHEMIVMELSQWNGKHLVQECDGCQLLVSVAKGQKYT